jgi:hypothetical protein
VVKFQLFQKTEEKGAPQKELVVKIEGAIIKEKVIGSFLKANPSGLKVWTRKSLRK